MRTFFCVLLYLTPGHRDRVNHSAMHEQEGKIHQDSAIFAPHENTALVHFRTLVTLRRVRVRVRVGLELRLGLIRVRIRVRIKLGLDLGLRLG